MSGRRAIRATVLAVAFVGAATPAFAQAWVAPKGVGSLTFATETISNTGHRLTDGSLAPVGRSRDASIYLEAEYAVTDRVSIGVGVPYVFARYLGPGVVVGNQPVDTCGCWNHAWQDVTGTARFNVLNGAFGLTPSVSVTIPSHAYGYRGEATVGRDLRELRLSVDAGQRLDVLSPAIAVSSRYVYTIVPHILGIPNNKSNVSLDAAFTPDRRWSVHGTVLWQRTHGGLRTGTGPPPPIAPLPWGEVATEDLFEQHDRLLRDNWFRLGGGASYAFPRLETFASFTWYASGTDTHAGYAVAAGITVPFEIDRDQ